MADDFPIPSCQQAPPQTLSQLSTHPVSKFNWRHLSRLSNSAVDSPLRCIAHIDLDAFYAQCEMVRLKSPEDVPLAVSQWGSLLAINYPARAKGLKSRMVNVAEARKMCPELRVVHIATWKPGERYWAYRPDSENNIATCKSCLDPYRNESKKIFAIFRKHCQSVEKGGTDEAFMDLGRNVYDTLLERYPVLREGPKSGDLNERLPIFEGQVEWTHGILVEEEVFSQLDAEPPDWDDVVLNIGAEIVAGIRKDVRDTLGYTCSGGIAQNKMLAKLGSAVNKPNKQTIVRPRAVKPFLEGIKLTKIRNLGGKLGHNIAELYETTSIPEMLKIPLQQFCLNMPQDEAQWLWNTIRGIDYSPVRTKQVSRSMLSSKQFRPGITNLTELENWMDIFCAEISTRLEEEGCATGSNRPKTVNVHWFRRGIGGKSRQAPITTGQPLDRDVLFKMAKGILRQLDQEKQLFPCAGCSFSVTGFQGGNQKAGGERAIESFFTKREKVEEVDKEGLDEVEEQLSQEMERGEEEYGAEVGRSPSPVKRAEQPKPMATKQTIQERMEEAKKRFFSRPAGAKLPVPSTVGQSPERKRFFTNSSTPAGSMQSPPRLNFGTTAERSPKRPRFFGSLDAFVSTQPSSPALPTATDSIHSEPQDVSMADASAPDASESFPPPPPSEPPIKQKTPPPPSEPPMEQPTPTSPPSRFPDFPKSDTKSLWLDSVQIMIPRKTPPKPEHTATAFSPPMITTPKTDDPEFTSDSYLPSHPTSDQLPFPKATPASLKSSPQPYQEPDPHQDQPQPSPQPHQPPDPLQEEAHQQGHILSDDDPITECLRCHAPIPRSQAQEHEDYHFAMELQRQVNRVVPAPSSSGTSVGSQQRPSSGTTLRGRGRPPGSGSGGKSRKGGQMRLKFG